MPAILSLIFSRVGAYFGIALSVVAVLFGVYRTGKKSARVDGMERQLENVKVRNEVQDDIMRSDPDSNRERLREWQRD
jgi:hypothetical protein